MGTYWQLSKVEVMEAIQYHHGLDSFEVLFQGKTEILFKFINKKLGSTK